MKYLSKWESFIVVAKYYYFWLLEFSNTYSPLMCPCAFIVAFWDVYIGGYRVRFKR